MSWWMTVKIAWRALLRNKMRSFLTMLGIIIGVASVITMLAVGNGAQVSIQSSIAALGSNTISVVSGSVTTGGVRTGAFGSSTLSTEDAEAIRREVRSIVGVAPLTQNTAQVVFQEQNWSTSVVGTGMDFEIVRNWPVTEGRFFTNDEIRAAAKVCVLGLIVARELFPYDDPVGQTVRVGNVPCRVVGVLSEKGQGAFGQSQDDTVLVPYTTAMRRLFRLQGLRSITASAASEDMVPRAVEEITDLLRQRHKIREGEEADFNVRTQAEFAQTAAQSTQIFTLLLGGIASVSLLVGGIGIMNIMLVSVTERVREIGIRMALGAKAHDIRRQFLVESLMLSLLGGLLGVILGYGLSYIAAMLSRWPPSVSAESVILSFCFSAAVGVFFGLYPAVKASQLDPIQALRAD